MRKLLLLGFCSMATAATAAPVTLKPSTTLHSQVVHLRDLFDGAGSEADRVLGPGPGPGGRIVVAASQLSYIARRYGVDWRPEDGGVEAVLARPGRPLAEAEVLASLRSALAAAGASADCDIQLSGFTAPMVPSDSPYSIQVTAVQLDPVAHRFSAILTITGTTIDALSIPVGGRVEDTEQVVVATGRLAAGTVLRRDDVRLAQVRASQVSGGAVLKLADAVGLELRAGMAAGQPLPRADLGPPILVQKGKHVVMRLDGPGLAVTGEGLALEPGAMGDRIRVQNPASRAVVEAEVVDLDVVRVEPGRPPLVAASGAARDVR